MKHGLRRFLASVTLAVLAVSLAAPPFSNGRAATEDCPPASGSSGPALVASMDGSACEHSDVGPCLTTLGCVAPAPALRSAATPVVTPATLIVLGAPPAPHLGDLYRAGPPTPPPSQI